MLITFLTDVGDDTVNSFIGGVVMDRYDEEPTGGRNGILPSR